MSRLTLAALTHALLLSVFLTGLRMIVSAAPATSRVDPRVWNDCENGGTAHFLVLLKDQTNTKTNARLQTNRKLRRTAMVTNLCENSDRCQSGLRKMLTQSGAKHRPFWIINMIAAEGKRGLVEALSTRDDVQAIESDRLFSVPLTPPQPALLLATPQSPSGIEPNLSRIRAPDLWALGFTGQGIVYADADTGVQWDHPALKSHYRGWNGASADHNYNWWDAIHNDINGNGSNPIGFNAQVPGDDDIHGTHTMGIGIGGDTAANQIGVAPGAKWICCRNMEQGVGRPSTYIECMQFFLAPTDLNGNNPDPDRGADTVGNSYECPPDELCAPESLHLMLENLRAAGIFMAAAAGNSGPNCSTINNPPALDASVLTVGATDNSDSIAAFSSRGPVTVDGSGRRKPDLVAPGVGVRSSVPGNSYSYLSGTSMAAPHVAGAVALLWSAFPHIRGNVEYTESILEQSAVHLTSSQICGTNNGVPNNVFGYGRIDLLAAYNAVNRPPMANDMALAVEGDNASAVTLSGSDPESVPLTFQIVQLPTNGLLSAFSANSGSFTYTPAHSFVGSDTIVFNVSDGMFTSSNAVLRMSITQPADTDHDGIPDSWEIVHSLNPGDSADGSLDNDRDGRTNFQEYVANTNPRQSNSAFRITSAIRDANGHNVIAWTSSGGTRYRVQFVDRNPPQDWNFIDVAQAIEIEMDPHTIGSPNAMTFVDDYSLTGTPAAGTSRYYRIRVVR